LEYAAIGGNAECIRLLLRHGADPNGHYKDNTSVIDSLDPRDPKIVAMLKQAGAKGDE
jgi:ankyrin repeat protein